MIPASFNYYTPSTLQETLSLLDKFNGNAKILAGGQSLVPMMKLRISSPENILDINKIPNLSFISHTSDGSIEIGAMTRYCELGNSQILKKEAPLIVQATEAVGDIHVRHRGTIGGSLCHADPSADVPTVLLALDSKVKAVSNEGQRIIGIDDFFLDTFSTNLSQKEILTSVVVPAMDQNGASEYQKFSRRSGDFAIVGVAVMLSFSRGMECLKARIALESVAPTIIRAVGAENELVKNGSVHEKLIDEASIKASEASEPTSDLLGSSDYKKEMVRVFTRRALVAAVSKAKRKIE